MRHRPLFQRVPFRLVIGIGLRLSRQASLFALAELRAGCLGMAGGLLDSQRNETAKTIVMASFSVSPGKTANVMLKANAAGALARPTRGRLHTTLILPKSSTLPSQSLTDRLCAELRLAEGPGGPGWLGPPN